MFHVFPVVVPEDIISGGKFPVVDVILLPKSADIVFSTLRVSVPFLLFNDLL